MAGWSRDDAQAFVVVWKKWDGWRDEDLSSGKQHEERSKPWNAMPLYWFIYRDPYNIGLMLV